MVDVVTLDHPIKILLVVVELEALVVKQDHHQIRRVQAEVVEVQV
jgi:hypothetical protein